jgi:hypothetical protein
VAGEPEAAQPYLRAARDRDRLEWLVENARALSRRDVAKSLRAIGDACRSLRLFPMTRAWYRLALARDPLDTRHQKRLFELDTAIAQEAPRHDHPPPSD